MCLFAKIDNKEFMAFYLPLPGSMERLGRIELRDENFQPATLDGLDSVLIMDEEDAAQEWHSVPVKDLVSLARKRMHESLTGLKELHRTA